MNIFSRLLGRGGGQQQAPAKKPDSDSDSESDVGELRSPAASTERAPFPPLASRTSRLAVDGAPSTRLRNSSMDSTIRSSIEPGGLAGKYSHISLLHRGRHAILYRALHRRTGQHVVLKSYQWEQKVLAQREAELLRRCAGLPGVVRLLEQLEEGLVVYNVLEGCQGGTLIEYTARRGGRLPEGDVAVDVALPLLRVLEELRTGPGLLHRNLKPEHILRSPQGLKLVDFVAAADLAADRLDTRVGTLEYMAPEVLAMPMPEDLQQHLAMSGHKEEEMPVYGPAADLWSLGCVLYEAISGSQPFLGESAEEMVHLQLCCLEKGSCSMQRRDPSSQRRRSQVLQIALGEEEAGADLAEAVAQALGTSGKDHFFDAASPVPVAAEAPSSSKAASEQQPQQQQQQQEEAPRQARSLHTGEVLRKHAPIPSDNIGNAVVGGQFLLKHSAVVEASISQAAAQQQQRAAAGKTQLPQVHGFDSATAAPDIFARHMFSPACVAFLRCLLNWEPAKRAAPSELMQHPWIQQALADRQARASSNGSYAAGVPQSLPATPRAPVHRTEFDQDVEVEMPVVQRGLRLRRSQTWDEPYVPPASLSARGPSPAGGAAGLAPGSGRLLQANC